MLYNLFLGGCDVKNPSTLSFTYQESCFTLHLEPVTWNVAFINCMGIGSRLAILKTGAIIDFSKEISNHHRQSIYYWVGLRRSSWYIDDNTGKYSDNASFLSHLLYFCLFAHKNMHLSLPVFVSIGIGGWGIFTKIITFPGDDM